MSVSFSKVDQFHDPAHAVLRRCAEEMPAFADYIKTASIDLGECDTLPVTAFAWPDERRYPVHTPAHAAMSYAYSKMASTPAEVTAAIKTALEAYGLEEDLFKSTPYTKVAEEVPYAYAELKKLPMRDAHELARSERAFLEGGTKLAYALKHDIACALVERAQVLGVAVSAPTLKLAGYTAAPSAAAAAWIEARALNAPAGAVRDALTKLAKELPTLGRELKRDAGVKVAATLTLLDEQAGLTKHYGSKWPAPFESVFTGTKLAEATVDLGNGACVSVDKLASLPVTFWSDLDGQELADAIAPGGTVDRTKLAEIVETLPLDLKIVIRSQLRV